MYPVKRKDKSKFITLLRYIGMFLPTDWLKTKFYLNFIKRPRTGIRQLLVSFYRIDHIYDVIAEFKKKYVGNFSILEFGVADGYAFVKKLYAVKFLGMEHRIITHGFDSFEGMPETDDDRDKDIVADDGWVAGEYAADYDDLHQYCQNKYHNFKLHKGYFEETLTKDFLKTLEKDLPILIWIDCDYYSSSKIVIERIISSLPTGCVVYFDEYEFNFGSRYTGEARIVHEINTGKFGDGIELVLDTELSLNSKRLYRFINCNAKVKYEQKEKINAIGRLHRRTNDSPFP